MISLEPKIINESEAIKLLNKNVEAIKSQNHHCDIVCDLSTCAFRSGKVSVFGVKEAMEMAKNYVVENSLQGNYASVNILVYDLNKDLPLIFNLSVASIFSGERYSNGYAIPKRTSEIEISYQEPLKW